LEDWKIGKKGRLGETKDWEESKNGKKERKNERLPGKVGRLEQRKTGRKKDGNERKDYWHGRKIGKKEEREAPSLPIPPSPAFSFLPTYLWRRQ
jgi:hypothetical protein